MRRNLSQDQLELCDLVSQISEEAYHSSWNDNIEYQTWKAKNGTIDKIGRKFIDTELRNKLIELHSKIEGWIVYDIKNEETFKTTAQFVELYKEHELRRDNWATEADGSYYTSEWFGAIIQYYLKGKKLHFNEIYSRKYRRSNVWIGWIFKMLLLFTTIFIVIKYYS